MALQFLATVSTASTFETRPNNEPSVEDLLLHTFKEEIMNTSVLNSYSGMTNIPTNPHIDYCCLISIIGWSLSCI